MAHSTPSSIAVYLEIGSKRTFAGALDWPGWCRIGRNAEEALATLRAYAPRYAQAMCAVGLEFPEVAAETDFAVVERLEGNAYTDFGAPGLAPAADAEPLTDGEVRRLRAILEACWRALDEAAGAAHGRELRKGPRGGGRDVAKMLDHVREADRAYIGSVGGKAPKPRDAGDPSRAMAQVRQTVLDALAASAAGQIPAIGPRGRVHWSPRYFVRRVAWHALDHAWEIEDRIIAP